jgi:O-antigen ligase
VSWLVAVASLGAVVAIIQFSVGIDLATRIRIPGLVQNADQAEIATRGDVGYRRVRGFALHPIEYGVHLAMVLPIALHLAMTRMDRTRWRWTAALLLGCGIPLSISRSGILALAVALLVFGLGLTWRQRANAMVLTLFATFAFMAVTPGLLGTIRSLFQNASTDNSVTGRTGDYAAVGEYISGRPMLGRGPGTYIPSQYRTLDNQYLATLLESGWIGLTALCAVLISTVWVAVRIARETKSQRVRSLARSLGASVAVAPVTFATFDALGFPVFAGTFVVMMGCLAALHRIHELGLDDDPAVDREFKSTDVPTPANV